MARETCCGFEDITTKKFYAALLAEFLGTMLFVLVGCGSALAPAGQGTCGATTVQISLGFAFSVATGVWITAHVSGGHINPAVSFGLLLGRRISIIRFILYVICQCGGAIVGALILKYTSPDPLNESSLGTSQLADGVSVGKAFGIEFMITFILVFTVHSCVDSCRTDKGGSIPLTIGVAIGMCHLWAVSFLSKHFTYQTINLNLLCTKNLQSILAVWFQKSSKLFPFFFFWERIHSTMALSITEHFHD